jgi:hypothetical protein
MVPKKTPPIGFGRKEDSDPNGTGDGFKWEGGEGGHEQPEEKPARPPMVVPVFVGQIEANEILAAYDIFPLAPLSNAELQLIQVVAALEKELGKHTLE